MRRRLEGADSVPSLAFGPSVVWLLAAVSMAVAAGSLVAPWLPGESHRAWGQVQRGLIVNDSRSVPSWWMAVLFVIAALAAHAHASWRARRGERSAAAAWWVLAAAMVWVSVDHSLVFHSAVPWLTEDLLPGVVGRHPVEVTMLVVVGPAAVLALATGSGRQRLLLLLAAFAYVAGQVGVGRVHLGVSDNRSELVESVLQWTGALLLITAAGSPRRRGEVES